ncbi:helix-turn-helix transcriptional regulator [Staphylococcus intermedius]|uniref:Helix-turn-helix family protein n=1 Tax=Staphylococcus intermedius NCTC 11048 TaxID=1141106 RepID=A0A380G9T6_STAIN|nr:helix-turn-helix domain-containing protein [Staphylococcus intermedius]PCF87433.1 transcriptional regulator [Staphylococcus intermedius]PNZ52267.1 transcriptional regulator [Staphylococcus intermedius NCTC 11048]SUM47100.1 helix-turn-helix family protein [Staphylococcus intermedius NCTC 11048]
MALKKQIEKNYRLKNLRDKQGYSQKDMGKFLGISHVTYSSKEIGKMLFTHKEMLIIAKLFNTTLDDLFWEEFKEEVENGKQHQI